MSDKQTNGRTERVRVKPGIYYRPTAAGSRSYQVTYRDSDKRQRWETIPGGLRDAEAALANRKDRKHRGERVAPRALTFGEAAERWLTAQRASDIRPSTLATYEASLNVRLLPAWGKRKLSSITIDDAARLVESMRRGDARGGKPYKGWTIQAALIVAGRVFDFAARRLDWNGRNPVRLLDASERPKIDAKRHRILTPAELAAIIDAAADEHALIFATAANTGARLSEVLGLRWESIDFADGTARIDGQLARRRADGVAPLKTAASRRTIELPAPLLAQLRASRRAKIEQHGFAVGKPDAFVFITRNGTPHDQRNVAGRALKRAVKAAKIAEPAPRFHDFRHTFASAWITGGGNAAELARHLGHSSPQVTMEIYADAFNHAARGDERRALIESMYGATSG